MRFWNFWSLLQAQTSDVFVLVSLQPIVNRKDLSLITTFFIPCCKLSSYLRDHLFLPALCDVFRAFFYPFWYFEF